MNFVSSGLDLGLRLAIISLKLIRNAVDSLRCEINSSEAKLIPLASKFIPYHQRRVEGTAEAFKLLKLSNSD